PGPWTLGLVFIGGVATAAIVTHRVPAGSTVPVCDGEYADSLDGESPRMREIEQGLRSQYTFLVRSSAKYECPYFATDGKLRRLRVETVEHGTAFAYEASANETFLLTNEHVAVWPEVTDGSHHIEGVHEGCKRVEDKLRIVHDEHDDFEMGHIPLSRVAVD